MHPTTGPALVAAALIALAGAQKLLDPTMTVGALRSMGLPSWRWLVRAGSAGELALGVAAITVGRAATWWLVAISYMAFALFVVVALRRGTMIGSCGCFGREDTPPHVSHVALNLALAGAAVAAAASQDGPLLDQLEQDPGAGALLVVLSAVAIYLLYAAYVHLPRALAAGRAARPPSG